MKPRKNLSMIPKEELEKDAVNGREEMEKNKRKI